MPDLESRRGTRGEDSRIRVLTRARESARGRGSICE
jgi:hypothetical protein